MNKLQKFITVTILCISVTLVLIHNPLVNATGGVIYSGDPNRTITTIPPRLTGDNAKNAEIQPQGEGMLTLTYSGEHDFPKTDWENFVIYKDMSIFVNAIKQQYSFAVVHWMQINWEDVTYTGSVYKVKNLVLTCLIKNDAPVPTTSEASLIGCVGTNIDRRFILLVEPATILAIAVLLSVILSAAVVILVVVWLLSTATTTLDRVMTSAKNLFGDWGVLIIGIIILAIIIWALVSLLGGGIKLPKFTHITNKGGISGGKRKRR